MTDVRVTAIDDVHLRVDADPDIATELQDHLTFRVPGYQHMPKYKAGVWDGTVTLYNAWKKRLYVGLHDVLEDFCAARGYSLDSSVLDGVTHETTTEDVLDLISSVGLPDHLVPHDYQVEAVRHCVERGRATVLSPTASGKSLIIYLLTRAFEDERVLIVVPTKALVRQMVGDFRDYGYDVDSHVHAVHGGLSRETEKRVVVTTWQSVFRLPRAWFDGFRVVIGDEVHGFKATSLVSIMEKLVDCPFRFGFTGTLDGERLHELTIRGLFGPVHRTITTRELMDRDLIAGLRIEAITLGYGEAERRVFWKSRPRYDNEVSFLIRHARRNRFLRNLATGLRGNTIVLFNEVEEHGIPLHAMIRERVPDRPVFLSHGGVDVAERDDIRRRLEVVDDAVAVVSYGTFSTGINVRNVSNVVLARPSRSRIRVLQSIGRGLRRLEGKVCTLYDVGDDLSLGSRTNHTLRHMAERIGIYAEQGFDFRTHAVDL